MSAHHWAVFQEAGAMSLKLLPSVSVLLSTTTAIAGDLPNYPVERWCNIVASASGAKSEMLYSACISQEQAAYDGL
jgi:hypothetical protein